MSLQEQKESIITRLGTVEDKDVVAKLSKALDALLKEANAENTLHNNIQEAINEIAYGKGKNWEEMEAALERGKLEGLRLRKLDGKLEG